MKKIMIVLALMLTLAACSNSEEATGNQNTADDGNSANENNAVDHGMEDKEVGFTLGDDGKVIQADVPKEEATAILAAYQEYIEAFNAEDLDRYMNVISENPEGFDREEDRKALEDTFATYDTTYKTSDETIVKYEENRAEVYATNIVTVKDPNSEKATEQSGRQVVVFKKEGNEWRVSSLHFIGNQ
ncbi:ketosteroid isomerase-like protein [Planomicrobium sp. HSC-17F08]|nr:ketosteroid isomerase-like protein [Planomicrobium sp. HSC-17F08]